MTLRDINSFEVGQTAEDTVTITSDLVAEFSRYSGDDNPLHMDAGFADRTRFKRQVAHGLSYASVFSRIIGTKLPGPGCIYLNQSLKFKAPVVVGDTVKARVTVSRLLPEKNFAELDTLCTVGDRVVLDGEALIMVHSRQLAAAS